MGKLTKNQKLAKEKLKGKVVHLRKLLLQLVKEITYSKFEVSLILTYVWALILVRPTRWYVALFHFPHGTGKQVRFGAMYQMPGSCCKKKPELTMLVLTNILKNQRRMD